MTQKEESWQERWDRMGWKPKNGLSPNYTPKEYSQEELDAILMEAVPKSDLTEEQFNETKRIWESERNMLKTVKYLQSVKYGQGMKLAKAYFDLYINDRDYNKI
jgi:hypothetical protein